MKVKFECCFCGKSYGWYEGVHENLEDHSGTFIPANCIVVKSFDPLPECEGEELEFHGEDEYANKIIANLCEECMHKLLKRISPSSGNGNYFDI